MNKALSRFLSFALMIGLLILALKIMNWVPLALNQDMLRRYKTIEEVHSALNMKTIYVPSYFPQQISWPPSSIMAQSKPFSAIIMEFTRADKKNPALVIYQSEDHSLNIENPIEISVVREKVRYTVQGRDAVLTVGSCRNDEPCSEVTWTEGKYTMTVFMKSTPFELTKIVESMLR